MFVRPLQFISAEVPRPTPDMSEPLRIRQQGLTELKFVLGNFSISDIDFHGDNRCHLAKCIQNRKFRGNEPSGLSVQHFFIFKLNGFFGLQEFTVLFGNQVR